MTEIVIKYNPIQVRADIFVEGDEIAKTSNLYRYRNTPLEDWIDVLIPELVDYSNDDNIVIEICSLQKYIDEVNKVIRNYEKKHRHVDIEVRENPSTGYKGRLNKISQIIEQIKYTDDTLQIDDNYSLDVLFVSMAESADYKEVLTSILPDIEIIPDKAVLISDQECKEDGFETEMYKISELEDRHVEAKIFVFPSLNDCSNKYWRLLKEKVNGERDYVLVTLLNSKPKKNDELFDYVAEQLEKKGKLNKSRFVFISDNPEDNLDYIQDEYGIKLGEILDYDGAEEILEKIKYYIQNISYVKKISKLSTLLKTEFGVVQEKISQEAERNKSIDELDGVMIAYRNMMNIIINHYSSISLIEYGDYSLKRATEEFIEILTENITNKVIDDVIKVVADFKQSGAGENPVFSIWSNTREITKGISGVRELLDLFKNGSKESDLIEITEYTLSGFLCSYLTEYLSLEAERETEITEGIFLNKSYSIQPFIKDKIDSACKNHVKYISEIEKRTEYGQKVKFFGWLTENISQSDMGLFSYSRTYLDYENNNYAEVSKKIRRRLKTVENEIESFLSMLFKELRYESSDILEKKICKIESMTENSIKIIEEKCNEAIVNMEISNEDKNQIANIDSLLHELENVINL